MSTLKEQFNDMTARGIMPVFEMELPDNEYLIVTLSIHEGCVRFTFDQNGMPTYFGGEIVKNWDGDYYVPYDDCFDGLDTYLETIHENMTEGFLMPNNLLIGGE